MQASAIEKKSGARLDRTERVANSLGRLALTVQRINSINCGLKVLARSQSSRPHQQQS